MWQCPSPSGFSFMQDKQDPLKVPPKGLVVTLSSCYIGSSSINNCIKIAFLYDA